MKAVVTVGLLLAASQPFAHHGPYGQFNLDQRADFSAIVIGVEWMNPHASVLIEVEIDGEPVVYRIELRSPQMLVNRGWQGDELRPGTPVRIVEAAYALTGDLSLICCARIYDLQGNEYFSGPGLNQSSANSGS